MMKVIDFTKEYITQAQELAKQNYEEERNQVPALPMVENLPSLDSFAENGLGVVALDGDNVVGFLGCYWPIDNAFTTTAKGTFSPIHAHGAVKENRGRIYKRMYQVAAKKWVDAGIASHAIGLYAHDREAIQAFFTYGFGLRCMDAIRPMVPMEQPSLADYEFLELSKEQVSQVISLRFMLTEHLGGSPCFMQHTEQDVLRHIEACQARVFVAKEKDKVIAFLEVTDEGETFATEASSMQNICGAFCLPEYRGKGVMDSLLNHVIITLQKEGYTRLGVDFESFNPTAYGFWLKHFDAYTNGVVRRIDESVL